MKKQYFFARLFVRTAKGLALLVILFGIGFCVLRCYQASSAADAVAYQPSPHLQQALDGLKDTFLSTEQIVDSFNAGNQSTTPGVQGPRFPIVIDSNDDLDRIATELSRVDQERQKLKESIVARFETFVKSIDYGALLEGGRIELFAPEAVLSAEIEDQWTALFCRLTPGFVVITAPLDFLGVHYC